MFSYHPHLNNIDWSVSGVNPQTRMFIYNITLANIMANENQGPDIHLGLRYNCTSIDDDGFGKGWELTITRFWPLDISRSRWLLCLADGRKIRFSLDGNKITFEKDPPKNFVIVYQAADKNSEEGFKIHYQNGVVELFDKQGYLTRYESQSGRFVEFSWAGDDIKHMVKITDMFTWPVVSVTYGDKEATIDFSGKKLRISRDSLLRSINLTRNDETNDETKEIYRFDYSINDLITNIVATGYKNENILINYSDPVKDNSGISTVEIPLVESITRTINKSLSKDDKNLEKVTTKYRNDIGHFLEDYQSLSIKIQSDKKPIYGYQTSEEIDQVRKIVRQYNEYGQLCNEIITKSTEEQLSESSDCRYTSISYADGNLFSLPTARSEFEILNGNLYPGPVENYEYDDRNNIIKHTDRDGMQTEYEYYYPGEIGLNDSFIRYIKSENISNLAVVDNAVFDSGKAIQREKIYKYIKIAATGKYKDIVAIDCIEENESHLVNGTSSLRHIRTIKYQYNTEATEDNLWFGNPVIISETTRENGPVKETNITYGITLDVGSIVTEHVEINGVKISEKSTTERFHTGLPANESFNGKTTTYQYDLFDRLINITVTLEGNTNKVILNEKHQYDDAVITITNNNGMVVKKYFDFEARLCRTSVGQKSNRSEIEFSIQDNIWDALGRLVTEKYWSFDLAAGSSTSTATPSPDIEINYQYDAYDDLIHKETARHRGDKRVITEKESHTWITPFRIRQSDINDKIRTTLTTDYGLNNFKRSSIKISSLKDGTIYQNETTRFDSMNRPAIIINEEEKSYRRYQYGIRDRIINDEIGNYVDSKRQFTSTGNDKYHYDIKFSPFTDQPAAINWKSRWGSFTKFDPQGRPQAIYYRGKVLVSQYDDSSRFPMLPVKTTLWGGKYDPEKDGSAEYQEIVDALDQDKRICTCYEYDSLGRVAKKSYVSNGAGESTASIFSYKYDDDGHLIESQLSTQGKLDSPKLITAYKYDIFGNLIEETNYHGVSYYTWTTDGALSGLKFISDKKSGKTYEERYTYEGGELSKVNVIFDLRPIVNIVYNRDDSLVGDSVNMVKYTVMLPGCPDFTFAKYFEYDELNRVSGCRLETEDQQLTYAMQWKLNTKNQLTQLDVQGFTKKQYQEIWVYDNSGQISSWQGQDIDGSNIKLGRDEYDNIITKMDFNYFNDPNNTPVNKDLSKVKIAYADGRVLEKTQKYTDTGQIEHISYDNDFPTNGHKEIVYYYKSDQNKFNYGDISSVMLNDGANLTATYYSSNGFNIGTIKNIISQIGTQSQDAQSSVETKIFYYDAEERPLLSTDVSGYVKIPNSDEQMEKKNRIEIANQYSLSRLKSTIYYDYDDSYARWLDDSKDNAEHLSRQIYLYLNNTVDCILQFDQNNVFSGFECFARLPDGTPAASFYVVQKEKGKIEPHGRGYSRNPTGDTFVIHSVKVI